MVKIRKIALFSVGAAFLSLGDVGFAADWSNTTGSNPEIVNNGAGSTTNTTTSGTIDGVQGASDGSTTNIVVTGTVTINGGIANSSAGNDVVTTASGVSLVGWINLNASGTTGAIEIVNGGSISQTNTGNNAIYGTVYDTNAVVPITLINTGTITLVISNGFLNTVDAVNVGSGAVTLSNSGTINLTGGSGDSARAFVTEGGGAFDTYASNSGTILVVNSQGGGAEGLSLNGGKGNLYITNTGQLGTAANPLSGSGTFAIAATSVGASKTVLNALGGSIYVQNQSGSTASATGITVGEGSSMQVENDGLISVVGSGGGAYGIRLENTASSASALRVTNTGSIAVSETTAGDGTGIVVEDYSTNAAIDVSNSGAITATGVAYNVSGVEAIRVVSWNTNTTGAITITNTAAIGATGLGANDATAAISAANLGTGSVFVSNAGDITVSNAVGVSLGSRLKQEEPCWCRTRARSPGSGRTEVMESRR